MVFYVFQQQIEHVVSEELRLEYIHIANKTFINIKLSLENIQVTLKYIIISCILSVFFCQLKVIK